jgi:predicted aldo/keto reductase-like oxidoreductase
MSGPDNTTGTRPAAPALAPFLTRPAREFGKPVCRLGLASHGDTAITADDVLSAVSRGVNFFNWSAEAEGPAGDEAFPAAVTSLGQAREGVVVCIQFAARTAGETARELRSVLAALRTDYLDVLTLYYVERQDEWDELCAPGGAVEYLRAAKADGAVRRLGVTSHQRPLAAAMARSGLLDCVMVRYNAAHRGAEQDVFPVTSALGMPVIAYTALRWGALLQRTPDDPPGFSPPGAPAWYRFVLQSPAVSVVLSAPHTRAELEEDLSVLTATGPLPAEEYESLARHGQRVRTHAGRSP